MDVTDIRESSSQYLGKIAATNAAGTRFELFDDGAKPGTGRRSKDPSEKITRTTAKKKIKKTRTIKINQVERTSTTKKKKKKKKKKMMMKKTMT